MCGPSAASAPKQLAQRDPCLVHRLYGQVREIGVPLNQPVLHGAKAGGIGIAGRAEPGKMPRHTVEELPPGVPRDAARRIEDRRVMPDGAVENDRPERAQPGRARTDGREYLLVPREDLEVVAARRMGQRAAAPLAVQVADGVERGDSLRVHQQRARERYVLVDSRLEAQPEPGQVAAPD